MHNPSSKRPDHGKLSELKMTVTVNSWLRTVMALASDSGVFNGISRL